MASTPSLPFLQKLVSKIPIPQNPMRRSSHLKETNFAKYNRSMYLHCRPSPSFRFQKHRNLVQTNKENIIKMHNQTIKPRVSDFKTTQEKINILDSEMAFTPKKEIDIRSKHSRPGLQLNIQANSSNLQCLLMKNKMKGQRNLMGFNILSLQKKYNYSRFELHTLHSIYSTLLLDCKHSLRRFKDSFEVMLNMNRITIRPQVLQKIFKEQQNISFEGFIEMYSKIDQVIFKQSIIDYVQILFEGIYHKDNIRFQDIVRILRGRITQKESIDIATEIYEQYDRNLDQPIKLSEITQLCHLCENFAKKIYRLYTSEMRCD